jgi:hypothetical protein
MLKSAQTSGKTGMSDFKVGKHVVVQLPVGRLVTAKINYIIHISGSIRLGVSFGDETAWIDVWQVLSSKESAPDPNVPISRNYQDLT